MENLIEFKECLDEKIHYTKVINGSIGSKLKRTDRISTIVVEDVYLSRNAEFQTISAFVKSQIRKAIKLYLEFMKGLGE